MTSVTQKISNFVGGISQQPDELINPNSVKDLVNGVPDIKGILSKRPGSKLINNLTTHVEGTWHHYYRDTNEQYFIRVRRDGQVDVWNALSGEPRLVRYTNNPIGFEGLNNNQPDGYYQTTWSDHTTIPTITTPVDSNDFFWVWEGNGVDGNGDEIPDTLTGTNWGDSEDEDVYNGDRIFYYYRTTDEGVVETGFSIERIRGSLPVCLACDVEAFKTAQLAAISAEEALTEKAVELEQLEVQLADTSLSTAAKDDLETKIADVTNQINVTYVPALQSALNTLEPLATDCGMFTAERSTDSAPTCSTTEVLDYFVHENDEDLQLTTINDYTFVTNRNAIPNLDSGSPEATDNEFPYEAFFYLDQLKVDTTYNLEIWDETQELVESDVLRARSVALRKSTRRTSDSCKAKNYNQVHRISLPDENGVLVPNALVFRLIVDRYPVAEAEPDGNDQYDCQWKASVSFISSSNTVYSGVNTPDIVINALNYDWVVYVDRERNYSTTATYALTAGPVLADNNGVYSIDSNDILGDFLGVPHAYVFNNTTQVYDETVGTGLLGLNVADDPDTPENEEDIWLDATIIGNGIFIKSKRPIVIGTPDTGLMTCINGEVNNATLLPLQCKEDYVVKVNNSFIEEDDYYVKFVTKLAGVDGAGVWEETVKPGILTRFDPTTMPHQIRRLSDGSFEVSPISWATRDVGDDITNPQPSFIGNAINKIMFFRNRLVMLSGENVIMSRPNEYFNIWAHTAQTVSDADPIDLLASSTVPSILYDGVSTASGLLIFSTNQQFLVVTDTTDIFSPRTAMIKNIGAYKYNNKVRPVHLGQTVGFLNDAGYRSRYFEIVVNRDYESQAIEFSKPVDQLIPSNVTLIADSKDDNMVALAVKQSLAGTVEEGAENPTLTLDDESRFVWIYKYFTQGEKRIQSAWFKWKLTGNILYHAIMDDKYYAVLAINTNDSTTPYVVTLQQLQLKTDRQSYLIKTTGNDMREYDYQVHMDNYRMILPSEMSYDQTADITTWRLPLGFNGPEPVVAYELELQNDLGYVIAGKHAPLKTVNTTYNGAPFIEAQAPGDWTDSHVLCGYNFEFLVQFPTFFVTKKQSDSSVTSDTSANLVLHRCNFNFDSTGVCEFTVDRKGRESYNLLIESTLEDAYNADTPAVNQNVSYVVPIYDRNTNVDIYLKSKYPTPTNLVSASWEGDYNPNFYKRV